MKLKPLLFCIMGILAMQNSLQASGGKASSRHSAFLPLETQLSAQLFTPEQLGRTSERVVVMTFHVKNDFSIEVDDIQGGSPALKAHVRKLLANGTFFIDKTDIGKSYLIKVHFRS